MSTGATTVDILRSRLTAPKPRPSWMLEGVDGWRRHLEKKCSRPELRNSLRAHYWTLGDYYAELVAARLVCVDEGLDGVRMSEADAAKIVDGWINEPKRKAA